MYRQQQQQQQPTYNDYAKQYTIVSNEINTLKQAMLQNPYNQALQNDYNQQIAVLTNDLNALAGVLQRAQNNHSNGFSGNQNVGNSNSFINNNMFNNNNNAAHAGFSNNGFNNAPNQNNAFGNSSASLFSGNNNNLVESDSESIASKRFGKRPNKNYRTEVAEEPIIQEPQIDPISTAIPLIGNEFTPFLSNGVTSEKISMGDYFKYSYKGKDMCDIDTNEVLFKSYSESSDVAFVPKIDSVATTIKLYLEASSLENNKKIVATDVIEYEELLIEKDSTFLHLDLIEKANSLEDLKLELIHAINNCPATNIMERKVLDRIDTILAEGINNVLHNISSVEAEIDSFIMDYDDLIKHITGVLDIEHFNNATEALDIYFTGLKYPDEAKDDIKVESYGYTSDQFKTTALYNIITVIYIDATFNCFSDSQIEDKTLMITPNSSGSFYKLLTHCKEHTEASKSNYMKIVYKNVVYKIFFNTTTKNFTILK